ncbi:MAG TPA: SCPU domain-containing protein [bacterium]|nr:SCPU domain-containing protein [bacterium]
MKNMRIPLRFVFLTGLLCVTLIPVVYAANCSVSAQGLNFGEYDLVNSLAGSADLTVSCTKTKFFGTDTANYEIELSTGSGSYSAREMISGASVLYYNLYTDATRATVWGNGVSSATVSGQIRMPPFVFSGSSTHTVYGLIPSNQSDVEPGAYTSPAPITVTVNY